jgi:hypothetical protein
MIFETLKALANPSLMFFQHFLAVSAPIFSQCAVGKHKLLHGVLSLEYLFQVGKYAFHQTYGRYRIAKHFPEQFAVLLTLQNIIYITSKANHSTARIVGFQRCGAVKA